MKYKLCKVYTLWASMHFCEAIRAQKITRKILNNKGNEIKNQQGNQDPVKPASMSQESPAEPVSLRRERAGQAGQGLLINQVSFQ